MTNAGAYVFNRVWNAMPWLRCEVKIGRDIIKKAKVNRIVTSRGDSEEGQFIDPRSVVEFLVSDIPENHRRSGTIKEGSIIEVRFAGESDWVSLRVSSVSYVGGTVQLGMEAKFS